MKSYVTCRAHLAIDIEDPMTIINADRFLAGEPETKVLRPYIEEKKISSNEKQQLDEMVPQKCIPEPASDRFWSLCKTLL